MCTERARERELERKRGGKRRKGEKERDREKNIGAKKPKLALVRLVHPLSAYHAPPLLLFSFSSVLVTMASHGADHDVDDLEALMKSLRSLGTK